MPVIKTYNCPVCGSTNIKSFLSCRDFCASGEIFNIEKCQNCGFAFTQQFPDEEEIGRYYDTPAYISHSDTRKGIINAAYHLVRKAMLRKKADLTERYAVPCKKGTLLDIGCGTGYYAATMKSRGWETVGIEKNRSAAAFSAEHQGIRALPPNELATFKEGTFDVITLWHVLEHLQELHWTAETLKRLLKQEGTLIIALPNEQSYDARHYKDYWAAWDVPRHLWHFSPDTFEKFITRYGFTIVERKRMPFDGFYISMLSEKYQKKSVPFIPGFLHGLIGWVASWFDYKKSSSVIYILKHAPKCPRHLRISTIHRTSMPA